MTDKEYYDIAYTHGYLAAIDKIISCKAVMTSDELEQYLRAIRRHKKIQ